MSVLLADAPSGHGTQHPWGMAPSTHPVFSAGGTVLPWALASIEGVDILLAAQVTRLQNAWCWRKAKGFDQGVMEMWWSEDLNLISAGSTTHWDVSLCPSDPCQLEEVEESKGCPYLLRRCWTLPLTFIPLLCLSFPLCVRHRRMFFPFYHQVLWDG